MARPYASIVSAVQIVLCSTTAIGAMSLHIGLAWGPCINAVLCLPRLGCRSHIWCIGDVDRLIRISPMGFTSYANHLGRPSRSLWPCTLQMVHLGLQVAREDHVRKVAPGWTSEGRIAISGSHEHVRGRSGHYLPILLSEICWGHVYAHGS